MSSKILRIGMGVACAAACACASQAPARESGSAVTPTQPASRNRDVITREELSVPSVRSQSVLEVVRSLRPHFLTVRGVQEIKCVAEASCKQDPDAGRPHASIDNGRIVPLEELAGIHANSVLEVRYLSAAQAMQKFGGAALEGPVILVNTIK